MNSSRMIVMEIWHRKASVLLALLGVTAAVALYVFYYTVGEASSRETARIMRDLGLNLRIISKETDMNDFWARGFSTETMPEAYVERLTMVSGLDYSHLLPTLKERIRWREQDILLVGVLPEVAPVGGKKPSMSIEPEPGTVHVGFEPATRFALKVGDEIGLRGRRLEVASLGDEAGNEQDITVIGHLHDVQSVVDKPGQISEIEALDCKCFDTNVDILEKLRAQLAKKDALPEAKVTQRRSIAEARRSQRRMVDGHFGIIGPAVVLVGAAWIGLLATLNVRERRAEIGVLRALGFASGRIAWLFLGKALAVGVVGSVVGFALGTKVALTWGPEVFEVTAKKIVPIYGLLAKSVLLAPALAALASVIPTMVAVTQDPADTLRER